MKDYKGFVEAIIHYFERRPILNEEEESLLKSAYKLLKNKEE